MNKELVAYYIENMASYEFIEALFSKYGIRYRKSYNYKRCKNIYIESEVAISEGEFTEFCRSWWHDSPIEYHKRNLSSGVLTGHSWHRAMPSMLHYSLQDKVRECISNSDEIECLLDIGRDIMKHEYFMVATHDICESLIIKGNSKALPPTRKKSISDFVFGGIPYDLKVSRYPEDWNNTPCKSAAEMEELAKKMAEGADSLRIRKQARKSYNGWGGNRFYIVVADQDRWINDTDTLLEEIMNKVSSLGNPLNVAIGDKSILVQMVEV